MARWLMVRSTRAAAAAVVFVLLAPSTAQANREVSFDQAYCHSAPSPTGFCRVPVPEGDFASVEPVDRDGFGFALDYPNIERLIAPWVFAGRDKPEWADRARAVKLSTEGDTLTQWVTVPGRPDPSRPAAYLVQVTYEVSGPRASGPGLEVELQTKGGYGLGVLAPFPDMQGGASGRSTTYVARVDRPEGGDISQVGIRIRHTAGLAAIVVSAVKLVMVSE